MSFTLPNRPLPDDPRSIDQIMANFDYVANIVNGNIDLSTAIANGVVTTTHLATAVKDRLGVNTNSRKSNTASNEVTTTTTLDTGVDVTVAVPDLSKTLLVFCLKTEQKASDGTTACMVELISETDSVVLTGNQTTGRTTYSAIDKISAVQTPKSIGLTTVGTHTFGIRLRRVSGAGTCFVRNRGLWIIALVVP